MSFSPSRPPARTFRDLILVTVLLAASGLAPPPAGALDESAPRPISPAERRATDLLLTYLAEGADAWWPELAPDSPYRRLDREQAAAEITVRMGPPAGSRWLLQTQGAANIDGEPESAVFSVEMPSGLDDTLELVFVDHEGTLRLYQLRSSVDPRPSGSALADLLSSGVGGPAGEPGQPAPPSPWPLLLLLCALAWLAGGPRRHRTATAALVVACVFVSCARSPDSASSEDGAGGRSRAPEVANDVLEPLAGLQGLRDAIAGSSDLDLEQLDKLVPESLGEGARQASRAWRAQILLTRGSLAPAEKILANLPDPSARPLVELLRARLALLQARAGEVVDLYDRAMEQAPSVDHLRLEAIFAVATMGREDDARIGIEMMLRMGSRMADAWYLGTSTAALDERLDEAERRFQIAFDLQPMTRAELFGNPLLSYIATRPAAFSLFDFASAEEPRIGPSGKPTHALELPTTARARVLGNRLELELGGSRLTLAGAASLTPQGTPVESAAEASQRETDEALSRLGELTAAAQNAGGLTHPARQRQARIAALALAENQRWQDLIQLTDNADGPALDADLAKLRSRALLEVDRDVEGKNLLIKLAQSNLANRRRDPGTLYQLAEMFVRTGEFDLALKLIHKANSMSPQKVSPQRIRQIEMDRELAAGFATFSSEHFILRYPKSTGEKYPRQLSWVLEAEWKRLQRWIPVPGRQKVEIHLFDLEDFMAAYSGGVTVLGIYDGKVRVPLADLKSFHPFLVNILSHEVAHAMIDLATDGNAPKWFHEGLASHVEMDQKDINPIPDMHEAGRDLSFAIIEPVLSGFSEPQLVGLAYSHATWAMHYVEAEYGLRGIHNLLKGFKRGRKTEAALSGALGKSIAQFDAAMRRWCLSKAPTLWPTRLVRYDQQFDSVFDQAEPRTPPPAVAMPAVPRNPAKDIKAWHKTYARRAKPVKAALGRALAILGGKQQGDLEAACRQLRAKLRPLLSDPVALKAPTESLAETLGTAYRHFDAAAGACLAGDRPAMKRTLKQATAELGKANEELSKYGLSP